MVAEPFDFLPLPLLLLLASSLLWAAMEAGYQVGKYRHAQYADEKDQPVGAMVASILGLLALVLGFTFSLAASRFDDRRQAVLQEANAIGTTYLRARLLPSPHDVQVKSLLRQYVDVRISAPSKENVANAVTQSEALHEQLWLQVKGAAELDTHSITTGLFIQSLNDVIDMHAKRMLVGLRSRIPLSIWLGMFSLAMLGMGSVGYQAALSATRRSPAMLILVIAFSLVLFLIADLDRGQEGLLRVNQQALTDLQHSMRAEAP